jgi:hypothetical protein
MSGFCKVEEDFLGISEEEEKNQNLTGSMIEHQMVMK